MKFNNIRKCNAGRKSTAALTFACLSGLTALGLTACSDNELDSTNIGQNGTAVRFQVTTADKQAQQAAKANPDFAMTRAGYAEQLKTQGLTPEDLATRKIEIPGNSDYCLIESTVAGIDDDFTNENAVATRAKITTTATLGKFSAIAYRGSSATGISTTPWFHNAEVNADGTLATTQLWSWSEPYARFYAVYPQVTTAYSKLTLSPASNTSTPYVNIEVEPGVQNQKDLMTACTGTTPIHYATQGTAPAVPLQFQHAMTAIRFKIGDRLSGTHKITKIEIVGAKSKGKFTLPSSVQATSGASFNSAWSDVSTPATFTLDGISVNTSGHVNETIVGKDNDNFTFYMIPQSAAGIKVKVYFDNQASPAIVAPFAGTWKAGTTKTYALSQSANNLKYTFEATPNPSEAANTEGATTSYQITSYVDDDKQHRPVKWKVVSYDADGDGTFSMSEKPDWLTIPNEGRTTTQDVEQYTATFKANQRDVLADFNNAMKTADPVTNYNLANATGADAIENTANCYIISAPGTYRIPLVYGNAIKGGDTNASAYTSSKTKVMGTEEFVLQEFVDHNDHKITSPYINVQNSGDQATKAKVIWEDCQDIVTTLKVTGSGADSYLTFTIDENKLQNGNAVVAVTNAAGTVMWSWHLWFTPKSSLKKIPFTSGSTTYNFMTDNLGWKYTKWTGGLKREVVVKIEQQAETGEKKTATITLKQAPGNNVREGYGNLYQWGRKDPLPGTNNFYPNTAPNIGYKFNDGYATVGDSHAEYTNPANVQRMEKRTIGLGIREPGIMLPKVGGGKLSWTNRQYINLWSADNDKMYESETPIKNGVKTIYDPSPVGFKVPDAYAFKDLSKGGAVWENGYTLKVDNDKDIYFQAGGYRDGRDGILKGVGVGGYAMYWASAALIHGTGGPGFAFRALMTSGKFSMPITDPEGFGTRSYGLGVRPVAE
ncbi:fimbrillin family protein [Prevotella melaninogenica]|uniref:fimbrillin family protein n=1 Tax=Prevotella melaninogenica TaxID=28132 RepID=UPI001C5FBE3A|nr:fimbrillin family protein [Prevotella melaninogenica]MBW4900749.1 fimbrillin family protein [Prevotella melaninogenica]